MCLILPSVYTHMMRCLVPGTDLERGSLLCPGKLRNPGICVYVYIYIYIYI